MLSVNNFDLVFTQALSSSTVEVVHCITRFDWFNITNTVITNLLAAMDCLACLVRPVLSVQIFHATYIL